MVPLNLITQNLCIDHWLLLKPLASLDSCETMAALWHHGILLVTLLNCVLFIFLILQKHLCSRYWKCRDKTLHMNPSLQAASSAKLFFIMMNNKLQKNNTDREKCKIQRSEDPAGHKLRHPFHVNSRAINFSTGQKCCTYIGLCTNLMLFLIKYVPISSTALQSTNVFEKQLEIILNSH